MMMGVVIVVLSFLSCQNAMLSTVVESWGGSVNDSQLSSAGKGAVAIQLPSSASRDISTNWAQTNVDTYSIFLYNNNTIIEGHAFVNESPTLRVSAAPGTYNMFVVAGKRYSSTEAILLGSADVGSITIVLGQVQQITAKMIAANVNVTVPASVDCGSTFETVVSMSYGGFSKFMDLGPTVKTANTNATYSSIVSWSDGFSINAQTSMIVGSQQVFKFNVTAPANISISSNYYVKLAGNGIAIYDPSNGQSGATWLAANNLSWNTPCDRSGIFLPSGSGKITLNEVSGVSGTITW